MIAVRPRKKHRIRRWMVLVPAVLCLAVSIGKGITIGFSWNELLTAWGIHQRDRFTELACLGMVCVAVASVARILRKRKDD